MRVVALFVVVVLAAACSQPSETDPPDADPPDQETLFQISTLNALQAGEYDGLMTVGELKQAGDFGLGTFAALDGEMIVLDGEVYQARDDGVAYVAADDVQTPFAAVTFFDTDQTFTVSETLECATLQAHLDGLLPNANTPYAIKASGTFASLTVRAPHSQSEPYRPLSEALADQVVFESQNTPGVMVGFRLPAYLDGVNVAGYHFHFISEDRQTGGHVLDCQSGELTVEIDAIEQLQLDGLQNEVAPPANMDRTASEAAEAAAAEPADSTPLTVFAAYATAIEEPWVSVIHSALMDAEASGDIVYTYADEQGYEGQMADTMRQVIADSPPDIIFGDAFGNEASVWEVAQEHPQIAFVFGSDQEPTDPNISIFDSWTYEPAYLGGMLAGGLTESNTIGVVAGFAEGAINPAINAFIAGAKAVNPAVDVQTVFINSWYDPQAAAAATLAQIENGADVIYAEREGVIEAAAERSVYTIGNMIDQGSLAPDYVVSSVVWQMDSTVQYVIQQVASGQYTAEDLIDYSRMAGGGSRLAPINRNIAGEIPAELLAQVEERQAEILNGHFVVDLDASVPESISAP